jgi:hydrogenase nickel incorporation protein HypA/HybF
MHELSLSLNILDLVDRSVDRQKVKTVHEVHIEVGTLSGVEPGILEEALLMVAAKTAFSTAKWILQPKQAFGFCDHCGSKFQMAYLWDPCPDCGNRTAKIVEGDDLEVVSIIISE